MEESKIPEFFAGKKVLITGATGFIGKVLIWKLLQSCPLIDTIYVLIRTKKGKDDSKRLEELLNVPIFDQFKQHNAEVLEKIVAIPADMDEKNLDLTDANRRLLQDEVSVVFHIAAILKMDASLKQAVGMNVTGTHTLLNICTTMAKLKAFVYVSTAFCNVDQNVTEEKIYLAKDNPYNIMNLVEWMDPESLDKITPRTIQPHPNTYTYSKRLAENVVADFYPRLPVVIARPSIVIPSFKEPFPGWVDNMNGVIGIMVAVGKGVLRSVHCNPDYDANVVPVDITSNALIAVAWAVAENKQKHEDLPVYNICLTETTVPTWNEILVKGYDAYQRYPFSMVLWYPIITMNRNKYVHQISTFFFQWIPAYIIDFLLLIIGYKRFMVFVQKRIALGNDVLTYFANRCWQFSTDNLLRLKECMSPDDQNEFPITLKEITDRQKYMDLSVKFARVYLVKEDPNSIDKNVRRLRILYVIHMTVKFVFYACIVWLLHTLAFRTGLI